MSMIHVPFQQRTMYVGEKIFGIKFINDHTLFYWTEAAIIVNELHVVSVSTMRLKIEANDVFRRQSTKYIKLT